MNLYIAITIAHDGTTDEGATHLLDTAGGWLKSHRPFLENAVDAADVAIVLGTADAADLDWPGARTDSSGDFLWLEASLRAQGYQPRRLLNSAGSMRWTGIPPGTRAVIVPDRVSLSAADADKVRQFAAQGGTVLAFGRGATLSKSGAGANLDPVFGVDSGGFIDGVDGIGLLWNDKEVRLTGQVIHVKPTSATVRSWGSIFSEGTMPVVTRNQAGKGTSWFVALPETAFKNQPEFTARLWREAIGEPLWKVSGDSSRYLVRVRTQGRRSVVHVIDRLISQEGPMARYRPSYARLSLNSERIPFQKASVALGQQTVAIDSSGVWKSFEIYPNPEVTIVLE
jgi:hypothetical protein